MDVSAETLQAIVWPSPVAIKVSTGVGLPENAGFEVVHLSDHSEAGFAWIEQMQKRLEEQGPTQTVGRSYSACSMFRKVKVGSCRARMLDRKPPCDCSGIEYGARKMSVNYEALNQLQPESEEDPFTEDRYSQFHKHLPEDARIILDLGCNTGRGGVTLKRLDSQRTMHGLDAVQDRLDRLPTSYTRRLCCSCAAIEADDGTYDAIVSGEFIEHIYERDVQPTLAECFRVLKLKGRLLMTTPNPGSAKRRQRKGSVLTDSTSHVSQHFPDMLRLRMRMAGFSSVRVLGSGQASRVLGEHAPMLMYGSFLIMGDKW